jgi:F-type H+-transporting ATPase subunit b
VELNWSTFVLEVINFLVLVWILKRFLYKPVLNVIARRRAEIEKSLADAEALHASAKSLQQQYEGRLAEWSREKQQARDLLAVELEAERSRSISELQGALEKEREKQQVSESRRQADAIARIEERALLQGARFATRLLEQAAGPELQVRLVDMLLAELEQLPGERIQALRGGYGTVPGAVVVTSAFPLADAQRRRLKLTLLTISGPGMALRFEQDDALLAGVRIHIGAWELAASLKDELQGFVALARHVEQVASNGKQPA